MKDTLYQTKLSYTKLSPPVVEGVIPKISKKKILEKLSKHGITEADVDKTERKAGEKVTYAIWLLKDLLLEITER